MELGSRRLALGADFGRILANRNVTADGTDPYFHNSFSYGAEAPVIADSGHSTVILVCNYYKYITITNKKQEKNQKYFARGLQYHSTEAGKLL
jgi:hypothetical protein